MATLFVQKESVLACSWGVRGTGLPVHFTLINNDGTVYLARTATGVQELSDGAYMVQYTFPEEWSGVIKWDDDAGKAIYEDVTVTSLDADNIQGVGS